MQYFLAIILLFYPFDSSDFTIAEKQLAWQHMIACRGKVTAEYWLATDPNYMCCDLNLDGIINFIDYAILTQKK